MMACLLRQVRSVICPDPLDAGQTSAMPPGEAPAQHLLGWYFHEALFPSIHPCGETYRPQAGVHDRIPWRETPAGQQRHVDQTDPPLPRPNVPQLGAPLRRGTIPTQAQAVAEPRRYGESMSAGGPLSEALDIGE